MSESTPSTAPKPSLYGGLDSDASVVARGPVTYDLAKPEPKTEEDEKKQMLSAALQFRPVRNLHSAGGTAKKAVTVISKPPSIVPRHIAKVSLDQFAVDEPEETEYARSKRQNRSKRRKKKEETVQAVDWEDNYDPLRPNNFEEYKQSEEKFMEDEDWRAFLLDLKHKQENGSRSDPGSGSDEELPSEEKTETSQIEELSPAPSDTGEQTSSTIAKAPVLYKRESPPPPKSPPPTQLPREKTKKETFAKRLLSKYGWTPGKGLGATSDGITKALHFSVDKSMKGHGKIVDKNAKRDDVSKYGKMAKVVLLPGVVEPGQVDETLAGEIGEECGAKYGQVERVYIHETDDRVNVYVKFTSELSALRAVNGLDGRLFNGNLMTARYYDETDFEAGRYAS